MNLPAEEKTRRIIFVCRQPVGESLRSAMALAKLAGVRLLGIFEHSVGGARTDVFEDREFVADVHDADQLIAAARRLSEREGRLNQIVTVQETLLEPVAATRHALGLSGMSVATVRNVLDKSLLKPILRAAGINTARDEVLTSDKDARRFVADVGFPIVLKPLGGSGGLATWCIRNSGQLDLALELMQPSSQRRVLAEDFVQGQELCIDTITIANEPQFYSVCYYRPSIMEALENPSIQWSCVMPRDISGDPYKDFVKQGLAGVRALSVGNAMTHMEGFLVNGGGVCFTDATLRPAGARIGPMLAFAYDIDSYYAWARVAVDGCFDGPWERKYAVGTIFLRGLGSGSVAGIDGIETIKQQIGELLVDVRLPVVGAMKSATYTGDGYVTVRHPKTETVERALDFISQTARITYSGPEKSATPGRATREQWEPRLQYFEEQLNRPVWESDVVSAVNET